MSEQKKLSETTNIDGRSRYMRIKKLLEPYVGEKMRLGALQRLVMIHIGTSQRVVRETVRYMIDLGLIVEREHLLFEVMQDN